MTTMIEDCEVDFDRLFNPSAVAIIGATDRASSLGDHIVRHAMASSGLRAIYPVNPNRETVSGLPCFKSVCAIPDQVDLAFILLPSSQCLSAVRDCGAAGIPFAVIGASGFGEGDGSGAPLARELAVAAKESNVRLLGPNTNGTWNARDDIHIGFNVSQGLRLQSGGLALLSQTGAMLGSAIAALNEHGIGLAYAVSTGNELDIQLHELLEYMLSAPAVTAIGLAVDSITNPMALSDVVSRANVGRKPIVLLQMGTSKAGSQATELHASRIADRAGAVTCLLDALGIAATPDFDEYLSALMVLGSGRTIPDHNRVLAVSTSGAGAALLADTGEAIGAEFEPLSDDSYKALESLMRMTRPHNPLDITGESRDPEWVRSVLSGFAVSDQSAPLVYMITLLYESPADPRLTAFVEMARSQVDRLMLACVPGTLLPAYMTALREAGVLVHSSLRAVFSGLRLAQSAVRGANRGPDSEWVGLWRRRVKAVADHPAREATPVLHNEAKAHLEPLGLRFPPEVSFTGTAGDLDAAIDEVGIPAALKLLSAEHLHKAASNALALNLQSGEAIREAARSMKGGPETRFLLQRMLGAGLDLFIGFQADDRYGGMLLIGAGGSGVERVADVRTLLLPTSREQIIAALQELRMGDTLLSTGPAGSDWDTEALVEAVDAFVTFVDNQQVVAAEVNPLRVLGRGNGAWAIDVRAASRARVNCS